MFSTTSIDNEFLNRGFHLPRTAEIASDLVGTVPGSRRYLVAMGIYPIPDETPSGDSANVIIAPFAAIHYYRICVKHLKGIVSELRGESGIAKQHVRIFSNSRLPERSIAAALGMGWVGRNGLLMNREYGSSFVLAGFLAALDESDMAGLRGSGELPRISRLDPPEDPHRECGSCHACVSACPTGAIAESGGIHRERCLQNLATSMEDLPAFALSTWGRRLYGCQVCQNSCPVNRRRSYRADRRNPSGEEYPVRELLRKFAPPSSLSLKNVFAGTALEASWIPRESILRNLLIAAGNIGDPTLEPLIRLFLKETHPLVRHAAAHVLKLLSTE